MQMKFVPTIRMILEAYPKIAAVERMRMERPCEKSVASVVSGVRRLCEIGEISLDEPMSIFTRRRLEQIFDASLRSELKHISVWSYLYSLRKLFARWTQRYYADRKWIIPQLEIPSCQRHAPRYIRPDTTTLAKVKEWYGDLEKRPDRREWVLATLMLEFAMRNGDVERLRWSDFRPRVNENIVRTDSRSSDMRMVLCYTPNKTKLSSGRVVAWPVHPLIWERLCAYHDLGIPFNKRRGWGRNEVRDSQLVVPCARDVYVRLNKELRLRRIFTGPKGCYELRKICIDHIYQKFGAEMASSISGDDIRTVMRYYADPSAVNVEGVRVVDLL
jgi:integrase